MLLIDNCLQCVCIFPLAVISWSNVNNVYYYQNYKNLVILGMLPLSLNLGKLSPSDGIFSTLLPKLSAVPESLNLRFQTYHNITKRTSTNRTYPPYIPLFQWYFLKSNFSVRSCGATNLKTSADWLLFLWWNLMYDVWRPVVCGVQYDDVMTSFIKTIKTQAEKA